MSYVIKLLTDAAIAFGQGRAEVGEIWHWALVFPAVYLGNEVVWRTSGFCGMRWITGAVAEVNRRLFAHLSEHSATYFSRPLRGRARQQDRERRVRHRAPHLAVALAVPPLDRRPRRRLEPHLSRPSLLRARPRGLDRWSTCPTNVFFVSRLHKLSFRVRGGLVPAPRADGGQHLQHRHRPRRGRGGVREGPHRRVRRPPARLPPARVVVVGVGAGHERHAPRRRSSWRMLGPGDPPHRQRRHQRGLPGHGDHGGDGARAAHVLPRAEPDPGRELPRAGERGPRRSSWSRTRSPTGRAPTPLVVTSARDRVRRPALLLPRAVACSTGTSTSRSRAARRSAWSATAGRGSRRSSRCCCASSSSRAGRSGSTARRSPEITLESLRRAVALVPQTTSLFHRTILENIRYGRLEASDEEVMEAARLAQADRFIELLPESTRRGWGSAGSSSPAASASGSPSPARCCATRPILLLDEATSALDSESEAAIQAALVGLMRDKTVIAIAHRLSTLRAMDRIVVLEQGRIVEDGRHEDAGRAGAASTPASGTYRGGRPSRGPGGSRRGVCRPLEQPGLRLHPRLTAVGGRPSRASPRPRRSDRNCSSPFQFSVHWQQARRRRVGSGMRSSGGELWRRDVVHVQDVRHT